MKFITTIQEMQQNYTSVVKELIMSYILFLTKGLTMEYIRYKIQKNKLLQCQQKINQTTCYSKLDHLQLICNDHRYTTTVNSIVKIV